jgi:hypothetical protein
MSFQIEKAVQKSADFVNERPKILLGVSNTAAEMDVFAASRFKNENIEPETILQEAWVFLREHQGQR